MNTHTVVFKNTIWNWIVFQFFKRFAIKEKSAFGIFGNLCFDTEKISMSERTPVPQDIHFPPSNIFTWIIWALFGNVRDGVLGDRVFNPEQKDTWLIRINWWFRNPFHNLTWYVIGFADKESTRFDMQKQDGPGWNFSFSLFEQKLYPFCLYQGKVYTFYFGWRSRGHFGIKFNK